VIQRVSGEDPRVLDYAHVGSHDWLCARDLFVAEGRFVVERLIAAGRFEIASVLVTPAAATALARALAQLAADVLVVDPAVLNRVTGFNFHRGCLALGRRPRPLAVSDLPADGCQLALEGVGNPDNVGGLFRTAAAFGVTGLMLDQTSGDPFYRKAVRTSMGAVLRLPFARVPDWPAALAARRADGWIVAALTPRVEAMPLEDVARQLAPARARLLLVGSEGAGLSEASLSCADVRVRIPISSQVDSLNVTVAAGIALSRLAA
jgi:tRNA G18 (ribose-2'-O)-methylase SpoU